MNIQDKEYDSINFRIGFIKDILKETKLELMVNYDNQNTENFIYPANYKSIDTDSNESNDNGYDSQSSNDARHVLNKKILNFYNVITNIGGRLLYIKSGTSGHTFKGVINTSNNKTLSYAVKVVAYKKRDNYGDINNINRPENAELMMIKLLSYFVVKCQTPHIVLPIGTFNTSIEPFVSLIEEGHVSKDNKKYIEFVNNYKKAQYHSQVSILMSEWVNQGDLLDFMRNNYREFTLMFWKVIFFQLLSVLAIIQSKYPSFRHNDLKANNVLIQKIKRKHGKKFGYTINKTKYVVPDIGYNIKIWDFDFACIPGLVNNAKVDAEWTNSINVKPEQNRYYDMHFFFNTMIMKGFFPQFMTESCIPHEAKQFVLYILPEKYRSISRPEKPANNKSKNNAANDDPYLTERGRIKINDEYLIPDYVLKTNPFFAEFRNKSHGSKK